MWCQVRPLLLHRPMYTGKTERWLRQQLVLGEHERDSSMQRLPMGAGARVLQLLRPPEALLAAAVCSSWKEVARWWLQ